jgi:hypothetical protein
MQTKLLAILFVTAIMASSFMATVMPMANALTARTDFSNRHLSASYGNSPICGDHICSPGEKTTWAEKISELQRGGIGKIAPGETYQDVLKNIQSTSGAPSNHKIMENEHIPMAGNATKSENSTTGKK